MAETLPLHMLPPGSLARVKELKAQDNLRRRFLDLGLIKDKLVESLRRSPSGDPTAYQIRGAVIALRSEEASKIIVELVK